MFIPTLNKGSVQRVSVPYLSGGINPGSVGEAVSDNQLTDCKNVWFKGGEVITRPKLLTFGGKEEADFDNEHHQSAYSYIDGQKVKIFVDKNLKVLILFTSSNVIFKDVKNEIYSALGINASDSLRYLLYRGISQSPNSTNTYLLVDALKDDKHYRKLFEICINSDEVELEEYKLEGIDTNVYIPHVILNGWGESYAYLPKNDDSGFANTVQPEGYNRLTGAYKCTFTTDSISTTFKLPSVKQGAVKIKIDTVGMVNDYSFAYMTNYKGDGVSTGNPPYYGFFTESGEKVTELEFNIPAGSGNRYSAENYYIDGRAPVYSNDGKTLTNRMYYRCKFHCQVDNDGRISFPSVEVGNLHTYKGIEVDENTKMVTDLFNNNEIEGIRSNTLTGENQDNGETKVYTLDVTKAQLIYSDEETLEKYVGDGGLTSFYKLSVETDTYLHKLPRAGSRLNNMEVIVYDDIETCVFDEIINCSFSELYGGTVGLVSGTRSFIGGSNHRVFFSDVDRPLYFPENCYFGVGANKEKVTALSKCGGYLVIFKENSIYYTYEQNVEYGNISEALQNQSVVDLTAQYRYAVKSINAEVGCDLPETIQLCFNKLIFANSDGNIYVLNSFSNYSERNIYVVSGLIKDKLKNYDISDWKKAFALDYQGYYMIFIDDMGFVLDYNRNDFKYISSYTSDSSVKKYGLFSWWIWQFPKFLQYGVSTDTQISMVLTTDSTDFHYCSLGEQPETECESYLVSKFFDFSAPDFYKGIERLQLELGNDYDSSIWIELLTDGGEISKNPIEIYESGQRGRATYSKEQVVYPNIKLCRKFGFKITANGPIALSSVIINYSVKGSVRNGN